MSFSLKSLLRSDDTVVAARLLYAAIVAQARNAVFYRDLGIPDSPAGRFDLVALHVFLVMQRLERDTGAARLARALLEAMITDLDRNLREMGVGDLSVGKKVKDLARRFYGLSAVYRDGLAGNDPALAAAIGRNLYYTAGVEERRLAIMTRYLRQTVAKLSEQPHSDIARGRIAFAELVTP